MDKPAFLRLNEAMALRFLLDQVIDVERSWSDAATLAITLQGLDKVLNWAAEHRSTVVQGMSRLRDRIPREPTYHQFMSVFVPIEREYGRAVADADILIDRTDHSTPEQVQQRMPVTLILENIRSAMNLGSILRLSDGLGIAKVLLCGYTAQPDQSKVARAALGAEGCVDWEWHPHADACIHSLRQAGTPVYALETSPNAQALEHVQFPRQPIALLCGNERYGLEASLLQQCDGLIEIPCWGKKNSLNVAVAVGMLGFEVRRQWLASGYLSEF